MYLQFSPADLAGELRPGLVIPGHWDMFADNPGDPDAFINAIPTERILGRFHQEKKD